jgi:diguanylate cyclase (GGDEF)-like protein
VVANQRNACFGAVMFMDLDNFKPLNDTYGHAVGDMLLVEVANRLIQCVRKGDTVARFGGDEFVVVLNALGNDPAVAHSQAQVVAEKIRSRLAEPYRMKITREEESETVVEHHCSASIGVVVFMDHVTRPDDLLKSADAAMYQAKQSGPNAIRFYADHVA